MLNMLKSLIQYLGRSDQALPRNPKLLQRLHRLPREMIHMTSMDSLRASRSKHQSIPRLCRLDQQRHTLQLIQREEDLQLKMCRLMTIWATSDSLPSITTTLLSLTGSKPRILSRGDPELPESWRSKPQISLPRNKLKWSTSHRQELTGFCLMSPLIKECPSIMHRHMSIEVLISFHLHKRRELTLLLKYPSQ